MNSPSRESDRKERLYHLTQMKGALLMDMPETAKAHGLASKFYAERITSYDYSKEDVLIYKSLEMEKKLDVLAELRKYLPLEEVLTISKKIGNKPR